MDVLSIYRMLVRRRWVVLPVAGLVVVALAYTLIGMPATYRAAGSVVLLNPPAPPEVEIGAQIDPKYVNPYVQIGDISVVVDIITKVMMTKTMGELLLSEGVTGQYTVSSNVAFQRGPLIDISSETGDPNEAIANVQKVAAELETQLVTLQEANATDEYYYIHSRIVVPPTRATQVFSATLRRLIAVGGLGVVLVLGSAITADAIARARGRRSDRSGDDEPDDELDDELADEVDDEVADEVADEVEAPTPTRGSGPGGTGKGTASKGTASKGTASKAAGSGRRPRPSTVRAPS